MASSIEQRVKRVFVEQMRIAADKVVPSASLSENLKLEDVQRVELILRLEEEFRVEMPDEDTDKFKTVGDIISFVQARVQ
jgi:acyl carrier protein